MKISVIIPLYNKEGYITRAVDSVLNQTAGDFELIVVDDGSTDSSPDMVKAMKDSRIKLIQKPNGGVSSARNKGIASASNELIAFLDADDEWKPEFLETIIDLHDKFPQAGLYGTSYEIFDGKASIPAAYGTVKEPGWEGIIADFFKAMLSNSPPVWSSALAVHKRVFDDVGGFIEGQVIAEDVEMWCRIALKYQIAFKNRMLATYYTDSLNRTYVKGRKFKKAEGYIKTLQTALEDSSVDKDIKPYIKQLIESIELGYAVSLIHAGYGKEARKSFREYDFEAYRTKAAIWKLLSYLPTSILEKLDNMRKR